MTEQQANKIISKWQEIKKTVQGTDNKKFLLWVEALIQQELQK